MRSAILIILTFASFFVQGQDLTDFTQVDKFKIKGLNTKVYFKDPLKELIKAYPDFDNKENRAKHELLAEYLHHNTLYVFQTVNKDGLIRSYELKGNPKKVRVKNYFNLDITGSSGAVEKAVDRINVGGSFFEHMMLFQTARGKEVVGKGVQIWGFFVYVESYENIKTKVSELIELDLENAIPDEILVKEQKLIEPLFEYQACGLKTVKKRQLVITTYDYDSLGNVVGKSPRTETDADLYLSSVSNDLTGVATFPFFSAADIKTSNGGFINIASSLSNINYYLKDIKVTMVPSSNQVAKIESRFLIHGFTNKGESIYEELYIAEFEKAGECYLPKKVKLCELDDVTYLRPRLTIDINYEVK